MAKKQIRDRREVRGQATKGTRMRHDSQDSKKTNGFSKALNGASIYAELYRIAPFSERLDQVISQLQRRGLLAKDLSGYCRSMIRESCSIVRQNVREQLSQFEIELATNTSRERQSWERRLFD